MENRKLHIVVYDLCDKDVGGGIVYMGYEKERANYFYMKTDKSDWYTFHEVDDSIISEVQL